MFKTGTFLTWKSSLSRIRSQATHNIRELLIGYRMNEPEYATYEIGRLMTDCRKVEPKERPSFHQLQTALGNYLESSIRDHYLDLSQQYLQLNDRWSRK